MATYTKNFNLEKPGLNETADIEVINNNMDIVDIALKEHSNKLSLQNTIYPTIGTANTYSVTIPDITTYDNLIGIPVIIKINSDSTGASTININNLGAKSLKKSNGINMINFKSNGLYTILWDGTNFQLQGEGGDYGTATQNDVKVGVPFGAEEGIKVGTYTSDATATASDIMMDKVAYSLGQRLIGTNTNKRCVTGSFDAGYANSGPTTVNIYGLPFRPRLVYIYGTRTSPGTYWQYITLVDTQFLSRTNIKGFYTYFKPGVSVQSNLITSTNTDFQIEQTGFYITFYATTSDTWIACDYVAFE